MQSRSRIHADPAAGAAAAVDEDRFDALPDSLVLLVFNRLADVRSLGRCAAVSRRFNSLVPLVDNVFVKIDRIITTDGEGDGAISLSLPKPRRLISQLIRLMLLAVLKPFGSLESGGIVNGGKPLLPQLSHHSPAQVLRGFTHIRSLTMELPVADVGVDDGVLLKWKAEFGSTLQSCVILGGTRVEKAPAEESGDYAPEDDGGGGGGGSIPESFYTNGGLKLRVVWTISSLIAASTRHYLLRDILKEHPAIARVELTDAHAQGTLRMGGDQLREFRERPPTASASANRTQVPACNMKLRYAPFLELSDGTRIQGATLVTIRPVADGVGGNGRRESEAAIAGAFDGPFREAAKALARGRTYLLEMNGF